MTEALEFETRCKSLSQEDLNLLFVELAFNLKEQSIHYYNVKKGDDSIKSLKIICKYINAHSIKELIDFYKQDYTPNTNINSILNKALRDSILESYLYDNTKIPKDVLNIIKDYDDGNEMKPLVFWYSKNNNITEMTAAEYAEIIDTPNNNLKITSDYPRGPLFSLY